MGSPHHWNIYLSPREAWDAMYQDCLHAEQSIEMEQYILENDPVGQRFVKLFINKALQGVKVFLLCDRYGSASFYGSALIQQLRDSGAMVCFYRDITLVDYLRPKRLFPRTHIKTLLVDSQIAYTGGVCIAERMKDWRDTQIRITGPVVTRVRELFDHTKLLVRRQRRPRVARVIERNGEFFYLQSNPVLSWHVIYKELVQAISLAQKYVYITTPFFAPNRRFRNLLRRAPAKGVKVMLLVPEQSDVLLADWMFLSYAQRLLKAGVRVFRYQRGVVHSKTVVIDDKWATIGSTNMDVLSFFCNREANLVTQNPDAVDELKQQFLLDLQNSHEMTLEDIANEPFYKTAIGYLLRSVKSLLY